MWGYFLQERKRVKRFRHLADEEKLAEIQGQWQQESPDKEYLEQVKCCHDTDCNESIMKKSFTAFKNGTSEEFQETWALSWLMLTGGPFCQALRKGIEGEDREEMGDSCQVISRAVGAMKPQEARKAKASWAMKAAKDRKEEYFDPAREEDISKRGGMRLELWEEHLQDPVAALDKALRFVESQ